MEIDLTNVKIREWQANNIRLTREGYQLATHFFEDKEPEFWAIKGDEKIRNDPPTETALPLRPRP